MLVTMVQAICDALKVAMEKDSTVLLLGEDIGKNGGVFRATEGLYEQFGESRVIDTPLAEAGMVGTSIGLCLNGFRPVVEIQFMGFVYPAFEQIVCHVARFRTRTQGLYPCPLVIRLPYGGGINAPEIHSDSTESLFVHIPGLKVVVPSNPFDAKGLLLSAIEEQDPVIFLEPIKLYRMFKQDIKEGYYSLPLEKAAIVKEGLDVTLISWGSMVSVAKEAQENTTYSCEIIDLRSLYPLDEETILNSVKKTKRVVIIHEAAKTAGLGAEIAALISEKAIFYLEAPILRVTGYDVPVPMFALEGFFRPNVGRVVASIKKVMEY